MSAYDKWVLGHTVYYVTIFSYFRKGRRIPMNKIIIGTMLLLLIAACSHTYTETTDSPPSYKYPEQKENKHENKGKIENNEENEKDVLNMHEEEKEVPLVPLYRVDEHSWTIVPIADANEKVVLLTIDDAPDQYTLEMANILKELDVKAIFFVNGHFLDTEEEQNVLKEIHQLGFEIGNHTYSHSMLSKLSPEKQKEEIVRLNDLIENIIGERPKFFRAPFGVNTEISKEIVRQEGMQLMNWTYGYDWEKEYRTKEALEHIMVDTPLLRNGANLLMHDREWTKEALRNIVLGLQEKGYEIIDPALIATPQPNQ
jgi:peptidoglycan-N-acetylglucosamine deacetylase